MSPRVTCKSKEIYLTSKFGLIIKHLYHNLSESKGIFRTGMAELVFRMLCAPLHSNGWTFIFHVDVL